MKLTFSFLPGRYGIYRCDTDTDLPLSASKFLSFTRTGSEVSIVCEEGGMPVCDTQEEGYACIKLHGPFALSMVGILAEVSKLLAMAQIPIFVISTHETDYILIREERKDLAVATLTAAGHKLSQ